MVGLDFEDQVGQFESFLEARYPGRYLLTKDLGRLSRKDAIILKQFFAVDSAELMLSRPASPKFGDIVRESPNAPICIYDWHGQWKEDEEGIAPDRVLIDRETNRFVLIEAKYGDTEGNAHIERAGARSTPRFLEKLERVFNGRARLLFVFGGPMMHARDGGAGPKIGQRGKQKGRVTQTAEERVYASARYHRQIETLFGGTPDWTIIWGSDGSEKLQALFEASIRRWLSKES